MGGCLGAGAGASVRIVNLVKLWKMRSPLVIAVVVDDDDACTFHFTKAKNTC